MSILTKICAGLLLSTLSGSALASAALPPPTAQPASKKAVVDVTNTAEVIQVLFIANAAEVELAELVISRQPDANLLLFVNELASTHASMNIILEKLATDKNVSLKAEDLSATSQLVKTNVDRDWQIIAQKPQAEFRSAFLGIIIYQFQKMLKIYEQINQLNSDSTLKATLDEFPAIIEKQLLQAQELQNSLEL